MSSPMLKRILISSLMASVPFLAKAQDSKFTPPPISVPEGFELEVAAEPPLVGHPMMASFDERGRLFIAESAGLNMNNEELEQARPNFIRMLEDTDGDGKFDKSIIFADKLMIPNGTLWLDGSLYVAEPPGIWRMTDTDGDGVADKREHIAGKVRSNGMSSTLHGPVLGPTGRLYWCSGQMGYNLDKDGELPKGRIAPGVFSLKPDGTAHEVFSVGGLANPVEVSFSPEGDVFGTVAILDHPDGARHDALMHWVYGGVYNISANDPCPVKRTGDFLPPMSHVGQVAPAGNMRYRGTQFGKEYGDNIFWAQFNTHKVLRTTVQREGGTFKSKDEDFLVSDSVDFHATDVFEDADGSLLVIDTGGWFRHGCPTSQIAKPEVQGAIYRIKRKGASKVEDGRGLKLDWEHVATAELVKRLDDPRFMVEDRAIATLAKKGDAAVGALREVLNKGKSVQVQRDAVWALSRINSHKARVALCVGLGSKDASVRQAAACAAGIERIKEAGSHLIKLVARDAQPSIRREAATALGRIGDANAVPALLMALKGEKDRFLQHSFIYAVIQINAPNATAKGLTDSDAYTRRGALLSLSQMDKAELTRAQVAPLLSTTDLDLQKAAFEVARKHDDWSTDVGTAMRGWLRQSEPDEDHASFLKTAIINGAENTVIQKTVAEALTGQKTSTPMRLVLLEAIKRPTVKQYPLVWFDALEKELQEGNLQTRLATVAVLQERGTKKFDDLLKKLALDEKQPESLRIAMVATLAPRLSPVDEELFNLVRSNLKAGATTTARLTAARTLAGLKLSNEQLQALAATLQKADALVLPTLLRSYARNTNETVGMALVSNLERNPAAANLSADEVARMVKAYPGTVQESARALLQKLGADLEKQQAHLEELSSLIQGGDFSRGKAVFFGKKATCSTCHRISGQGGLVGPNLSHIAGIRTGRDLLESIIYPSASIVQGFRPFNIETIDDQSYTGIIIRQTPEAVWVRGTDLAENKIEMKRVKSMLESNVSIMPQGLGDALSKDELRDLLAYLQALK
jgi:putative membrane-bound dehydrogenase-like protein